MAYGDRTWAVGERVERCSGGFGDLVSIETVERVTPSGLPVVRGTIYRKDGSARGDGGWRRSSIKLLTSKREAEIAEEIATAAAWREWCRLTDRLRRGDIPTAALRDICAAIQSALPPKKEG